MARALKIAILLSVIFSAQAVDTLKVQPKPLQKIDSISIPTNVVPKQPTNWSKIKDLFL